MKNISLLSGYIFLILATLTGITSNSFLKTTVFLGVFISFQKIKLMYKSQNL